MGGPGISGALLFSGKLVLNEKFHVRGPGKILVKMKNEEFDRILEFYLRS